MTSPVLSVITSAIGAIAAIVYVGFFAYKVAAPPLIVIVVVSLALMLYAFYDDLRGERRIARMRRDVNTTP